MNQSMKVTSAPMIDHENFREANVIEGLSVWVSVGKGDL